MRKVCTRLYASLLSGRVKASFIEYSSSRCVRDPSPVAKHLLNDPKSFSETAKYWAQAYAGAPLDVDETDGKGKASAAQMAGLDSGSVKKFMDMGFAEGDVVS